MTVGQLLAQDAKGIYDETEFQNGYFELFSELKIPHSTIRGWIHGKGKSQPLPSPSDRCRSFP